MRYLLHYRVKRSQELIQNTDCALKEVAELAGFKSIHHFTRVFRDIVGETPGAWRQKYRVGICKDVCIDPGFSNAIWTVQESRSGTDAETVPPVSMLTDGSSNVDTEPRPSGSGQTRKTAGSAFI
jgi:hypothetical protein